MHALELWCISSHGRHRLDEGVWCVKLSNGRTFIYRLTLNWALNFEVLLYSSRMKPSTVQITDATEVNSSQCTKFVDRECASCLPALFSEHSMSNVRKIGDKDGCQLSLKHNPETLYNLLFQIVLGHT